MRFEVLIVATALMTANAPAGTPTAQTPHSSTQVVPERSPTPIANVTTSSDAPANPKLDARARRRLEVARSRLDEARRRLARIRPRDRTPTRLRALNGTISSLRRVWRVVSAEGAAPFAALRPDVAGCFVRALDDHAAIYLGRGSLPQARKRIDEALAVAPTDARTLELAGQARVPVPAGAGVRLTAARSKMSVGPLGCGRAPARITAPPGGRLAPRNPTRRSPRPPVSAGNAAAH